MRPAPALDCSACGRTIGKRAGHSITEDNRVICTRCLGDKRLHGVFWPECPDTWHDMYDHTPSVCGTRAGVAWKLGLWNGEEHFTEPRSADDR